MRSPIVTDASQRGAGTAPRSADASGPLPDPAANGDARPGPARPGRPGSAEVAADAAIMASLAAGEPDALASLYDRFGRPAYALARRVVIDPTLAEDVVQEVFLAVWRAPERYDASRGTVSSWLLTLVHHRAVDAVRREATRRRHTVAPAEDGDERDVPPGPGADVAAVDAVVAGHVRDALQKLAPDQRQVLTLAYFGGLTQSEVAERCQIPLGTVKSRMFTAVRKLRVLLEPYVAEGDR